MGLRASLSRAAGALPVLLRDSVGLVGAGAVIYGVGQVYVPAGWIVGGAMLMVAAWLMAGRS